MPISRMPNRAEPPTEWPWSQEEREEIEKEQEKEENQEKEETSEETTDARS